MTDDPWAGAPIVATVTRSGFIESRHRGAVVALDADSSVALARGPVEAPIFGRSSNKPLQAVAILRAGAELDSEATAMASASHWGEPRHLEQVRRMLAAVGLDEKALRNTPDYPLSPAEQRAVVRADGGPASITQNCSGKHAAMLSACVAAGWPTETYLDADHPLQQLIAETIASLAGEPVAAVGVDGCGAPVHAVSLTGLARAFRALAVAPAGTDEARVANAMRAHPLLVAGTGQDDTRLMTGIPGLVAKGGAEAVFAAAMPDGRAVALKIDDGGRRARTPLMLAALTALGIDTSAVADRATTPVLGGGHPVGEVRAVPLLG